MESVNTKKYGKTRFPFEVLHHIFVSEVQVVRYAKTYQIKHQVDIIQLPFVRKLKFSRMIYVSFRAAN